ncbi:cytochrome C [Herbaspirillum sp. meg3]|uniref:c-type cytochrome n=1 Tax=Herbaspirillum sp. meg3 TaxID=2025949 RepID=UPI000B987837|nr:cytochrome c [Herbaspirillum sp. meg3]ASU38502.1 cytochrome C [Herbaspirillum sp. meg3]
MIFSSLSDWINLLLSAIQVLQESFLHALATLGLAQSSHGQPAWPFSHRLSGEVLLIDRSVARQLLSALGWSAAALLSFTIALLWRRGRLAMLLISVVIVLFTSWPNRRLLLAPAEPTSFHVSPSGFSAAAIVHGKQLYDQRCASCHAADGKGDTPLALSTPVAPPNLASGLLWRRADGELFWKIAYGMHDHRGTTTMPGFTGSLTDNDLWDLIDFMKANAAGTSIRDIGTWDQPVALPTLTSNCEKSSPSSAGLLNPWRGQRVRLVLASAKQPASFPLDDPRLRSVILADGAVSLPASHAGAPAIDCLMHSDDAWKALSIITGVAVDKLAGTQLLTDRDGWLRARKPADDKGNWSESDILCRAPTTMNKDNAAGGLDSLIAAMDAEPVRFVKGGFVHTTQ